MALVLTVDQQRSRYGPDLVDPMLQRLERYPTLRPFERTAGDEFQGVLGDGRPAVGAILDLVRDGHWSIGVGLGVVDRPPPASTRAGRGPAFLLAREAVSAAKKNPQHVAVRGSDPGAAEDAEAVLTLLAAVLRSRTPHAWQAIDLAEPGRPQSEVAAKLGITRQAVSQRLAAAHWREEQSARPLLQRLLEQADPEATMRVPGGVPAILEDA
jgi:hypothetical protein